MKLSAVGLNVIDLFRCAGTIIRADFVENRRGAMKRIVYTFCLVLIFWGFDAFGATRSLSKADGDAIFTGIAEEINGLERRIGESSSSRSERRQFYRDYDALVGSVNQAFSKISVGQDGYQSYYHADDSEMLRLLMAVNQDLNRLQNGISGLREMGRSERREFDRVFMRLSEYQTQLIAAMGGTSGYAPDTGGIVVPGGGSNSGYVPPVYPAPAPSPGYHPDSAPDPGYGSAYPVNILSDSELQSLAEAVNRESFGNGKLGILKEAARYSYFSTDQVVTLLRAFDFDNERVNAAISLFPRVVDAGQWYKVYEVFDFSTSKEKVRSAVAGMEPAPFQVR